MRQLNSYGVQPDIIIARSEKPLDKKRKAKISLSCSVPIEQVISAPDVTSIYDVPINFEKDNISNTILTLLKMKARSHTANLAPWKRFVARRQKAVVPVKIAVIGKYFDTGDYMLADSYLSVIEAVKYGAYYVGRKPEIHWLNAFDYEKKAKLKTLDKYDGIIVPGGFGERGVEGKINVIRHARERKIPYFGLCYGMQLAVVEFARNVCGLKNAYTTEIDSTTLHPVIDVMPEQKKIIESERFGGSMRLGSYLAILQKGTIARKAYGKELIKERHRHRYEASIPFSWVRSFIRNF